MNNVINLNLSEVQRQKPTKDISDKKMIVRKILNILKRSRLQQSDELTYIFKRVRERMELVKIKRLKKLPQLLTTEELNLFMKVIDAGSELQHQLLFRIMMFCAVRVTELVNIKISDIYLEEKKITIENGKGGKTRTVIIPDQLKLLLSAYLKILPNNKYLFENNRNQKISSRMVQRLCKFYQNISGITKNIHPHLFRHQSLTFLTEKGLTDAQIQLISGHSTKKSLEVYQHLSLRDVRDDYEKAIEKMRW